MARCYVKAFFDWIEQTAALSDAERGRLFIAILEYARSGLDPKLDGREGILFPVFQSQIDRDKEISNIRAANGSMGGSSKPEGKQKKAKVSKSKQTEANFPNKEEEKEKDKDKDKDGYNPLTPFEGATDELTGIFQQWLTYKSERREGYKPTGLKSLQVQIQRAAAEYGDHAVAQLITECMAANWKGIIFDRLKDTSRKPRPSGNVFAEIAMEGVPYDE